MPLLCRLAIHLAQYDDDLRFRTCRRCGYRWAYFFAPQ